jgi:hypothetical protein
MDRGLVESGSHFAKREEAGRSAPASLARTDAVVPGPGAVPWRGGRARDGPPLERGSTSGQWGYQVRYSLLLSPQHKLKCY